MKVNNFHKVVTERLKLNDNDYGGAYYDLANVFEEYLDFLKMRGDKINE